jgi:uncharacterized protein YjbJ (UPF0337 family)
MDQAKGKIQDKFGKIQRKLDEPNRDRDLDRDS